ncbi:MAG: SufE family protein [Hyphomonadaceae bacterium]
MTDATSSPSGPIAERAAAIRDDFAFLDDWEARFQHIIDLGKALPGLTADERSEANKVRGCTSQVWLVSERGPGGELIFRGESDAAIVSGLVAILLQLYSGAAPADARAFDAEDFFRDIGIADALTPQRSNGLKSMLARIRAEAEAAA